MYKKRLLGFYDYTVILTYAGMLFAVTGILSVLNQDFHSALLCLMLAGVCDMFDGTVANTKERNRQEKNFGIQIDSLSDLISFGVLPGIFVFAFVGNSTKVGIICAFYILCALIRLAYFNVVEEERQSETDERRTSYLGLPVTTIAIFLPALYILYGLGLFEVKMLFVVLLLVVAICFVSPFEIKKPHSYAKVALVILGISELAALLLLGGVK